MKALVKLKPEPGLYCTDVPKPELGPNDVLVNIKKTAICGTDLHIYQWDKWAQKTIPVPIHIGHEFMGIVEATGLNASVYKKGDRVSGEGHITCGHCRNCRAGNRHLCRNTIGVGVNRPGAFAEYLVIPESNVFKLPDHISDEVASILDPFGNAAHCALAFDVVGEDVLITGAGPVGIMAAAIVKHIGARHVVITDVNPYRLKLAEKVGVTAAVDVSHVNLHTVMKELNMREGFDIGIEMSGNPNAFKDMLELMNNGGRIAFLGIPVEDFAINWHHVVFKSLTIQGIYGRRMYETWYKMANMLSSGLDITPVITHRFFARDFQQAFDIMLSGEAGKVILDWT
ncbi:MAG: L-threonine 3-dehydrogenase [Coxiella sp. RIFCSPHIGHO2_12_FULL_42_15]|nr:MAG: L-threonine 3-dehydrogenase [Coxiella sp. RIFCSPHIGHO2_12_FULL_42_15]